MTNPNISLLNQHDDSQNINNQNFKKHAYKGELKLLALNSVKIEENAVK